MHMQLETIDGTVTRAILTGRLDIAGAQGIDLPFNVMVGSKKAIILDLSGVTFIASMGLRTLIMGAKKVASNRGKMVLFGPSADVTKVLEDSGTTALLSVYSNLDEAVAAVGSTP